jgi:hypothetical protein
MRTYQNLILSKVHVISRSAGNYKINKTRYHKCFFSNDKKLITITKAVN